MYGSPAMAGARPAAPIATAWAVINHLGVDGFCEIMRDLRDTFTRVRAGIDAIDGLSIVGDPIGPVLCFEGDWHRPRTPSPT